MTSAATGASRFTHSISAGATSAVDHWGGGASVSPACGAAGAGERGDDPACAGSDAAGWGSGPETAAASARTCSLGAAAPPGGVLACSETACGVPRRGITTESVTKLVMAATESAAEQ